MHPRMVECNDFCVSVEDVLDSQYPETVWTLQKSATIFKQFAQLVIVKIEKSWLLLDWIF